jgi:hypothetical protein
MPYIITVCEKKLGIGYAADTPFCVTDYLRTVPQSELLHRHIPD